MSNKPIRRIVVGRTYVESGGLVIGDPCFLGPVAKDGGCFRQWDVELTTPEHLERGGIGCLRGSGDIPIPEVKIGDGTFLVLVDIDDDNNVFAIHVVSEGDWPQDAQ